MRRIVGRDIQGTMQHPEGKTLEQVMDTVPQESIVTNPPHCKLPVRGVSQSAGSHPDQEIIRQTLWFLLLTSKPEQQSKFYARWKGEVLLVRCKFNSDHPMAVYYPKKMQEHSIQGSAIPQASTLCGPS